MMNTLRSLFQARTIALIASTLLMAGCNESGAQDAPQGAQSSGASDEANLTAILESEELALVLDFFNRINPLSTEENIEICTYLVLDNNQELGFARPERGVVDSCTTPVVREPNELVALLHTHGAFTENYSGEIPSPTDFLAAKTDGVDGFLATPGGRLWFIDHQASRALLVCGPLDCVVPDPNYQIENDPYLDLFEITLDQLLNR